MPGTQKSWSASGLSSGQGDGGGGRTNIMRSRLLRRWRIDFHWSFIGGVGDEGGIVEVEEEIQRRKKDWVGGKEKVFISATTEGLPLTCDWLRDSKYIIDHKHFTGWHEPTLALRCRVSTRSRNTRSFCSCDTGVYSWRHADIPVHMCKVWLWKSVCVEVS